MSDRHFKFSVSSLSCAPDNIFRPQDICIPPFATAQTVKRILALKKALAHVYNADEFSVSLHVGYLIVTSQITRALAKHSIPISSLDTPDVQTWSFFFKELIERLIKREGRKIKNQIGWQLASESNIPAYEAKVQAGLSAFTSTDPIHFARTSATSWRGSFTGPRLIEIVGKRRHNDPTLAIALEIDAGKQTPEEYFQFVADMNNEHPDIPFYYDLDIGHIAESLHHRRTYDDGRALIPLIHKLLNHPVWSQLIGLISLNQYDHINHDTHVALTKGSVDYVAILKMIGEARKNDILPRDPLIMAEFSPFAYEDMISKDGIAYFQALKEAYLS